MRKLLLFLLFYCLVTNLGAQTGTGKISGIINDAAGKPLQSVTVSLLRAADSSVLTTVASAKDGRYSFTSIGNGNYVVSASSVGYEKARVSVLHGNGETMVPLIGMVETAKKIGEVTVTSKRPFIETKIDKTVVNVDASPSSAGATALEILEKSPGVSVSNDGAISLRGKAGVIVMMDGKPTFLSPTDLANLLKNMPASTIDQIEIMTNPSSKYDAEGNSGVINIKTKKGKNAGFNGSIMVGLTGGFFENKAGTFYVTPRVQNSFNFNYRKNKINLFGNYNPNLNRGRNELEISRTRLDQSHTILGYNDVLTNFAFGNENHTLKLGLDYYADKNNTFGVVLSGFSFSGHPTPTTTTIIADENHDPTSILISKTNNKIHFKSLTGNFNYRHQFDSTGRELTVDFDYIRYHTLSDMTLTSDFYDGNRQPVGQQLILKGHLPGDISIYSVKSDYVHPFRKGGRLEVGIKSSFVKNDNLVNYVRWDGSKWVNDSRSNHFIYDENINAVYVNGNKQFGKWSFQAGLRMENTNAKGYQVTNDSTFKRDFTSLFPSAFASYEVNKNNTITLSYSRRINRPNYQDLNPFIYFLDSLSYRKGNPFLLPQYTHNMELSYSYKGRLITTLNYNQTTDVISQILKPDGNLIVATSDNVAKFQNIGIAVTATFPMTKWWNFNTFVNVFNNHYEGVYEAKPLELRYTSFMINMTQSFTIKKGFTVEASGFYRAKGVEQLSINEPMYVISFAAQKQVMKGKGTLRLNLRDPFWLQKYAGRTQYDVVDTRIANRWDNRQATLSFTWRFGKTGQQVPPPRRRSSASQDEQNRVGQGQ
jgi:iron complex outermembrane receptor protein